MFSFRRKVGNQAEDYALNYLKKQKLTLLKRNYVSKFGEIDLIMLAGETLVFIEVRYRQRDDYGGALASVDTKKQKKIIRTAEMFLITHPQYQHFNCRFDVLAVQDVLKYDTVCWVKDAFQQ